MVATAILGLWGFTHKTIVKPFGNKNISVYLCRCFPLMEACACVCTHAPQHSIYHSCTSLTYTPLQHLPPPPHTHVGMRRAFSFLFLFFKAQNRFIHIKRRFESVAGRLWSHPLDAEYVCFDLLEKHFLTLEMKSLSCLFVYGRRLMEGSGPYVSVSLTFRNPQ